jgi:hypothetical protein
VIRSGILLLALAAPAAAEDWQGVVRMVGDIRSADPALAFRSAAAACIAGRGNADGTALIFESAGWVKSPDEAGLIAFDSSNPDVYVLMSETGDFCAAFSETKGTEDATKALFAIAVAGFLSLDTAPGDFDCKAYALAEGIVAEVTSSGNDPMCRDPRSSALRITFGPVE